MANKEKRIVLIDLCARLPYGVKGLHRGEVQSLLIMDTFGSYQVNGYDAWFNLSSVEFKPYLRPMSSMTEEEKRELSNLIGEAIPKLFDAEQGYNPDTMAINAISIDYCNSHHLDYRGLIPMGLALEAPEGMYKN